MSTIAQNSSSFDPTICRDFLRNVCKRGRRCKFKHPGQNECDMIRRSERVFCHDFQNSTCNRPACKFLHYSREAEEVFRLTGRLPDEADSPVDATRFQSTEEKPPICKDYLNGLCSRGSSCKYRHVSDHRLHVHSLDSSPKFWSSDTAPDSRSTIDLKPVLCTPTMIPSVSVSIASAMPTSMGIEAPTLQHQNILALQSASHIRLPQTATISGVVVSAHDATLTAAQGTPIMNVVDRLTIPSSNIQHTLYAHPSNLGTFTPLVSVSSTNHAVPCSSVLAVVADAAQHPTVLQHPTAVATSQTTYHWLSNAQPPVQHHLLSTSSNVSSTPTLVTIPLPSFACDTGNHGPIMPHASVVCSTPQQPTVITSNISSNTTLTNVSATCYPSYNLLHINQPSVIESPSLTVLTNRSSLADTVPSETNATSTTSVSSSTTAALAAAAAAGYFAQHLPIMTASQPTMINDTACNVTVPTCCAKFIPHTEHSGNTQSATLAAATNLPTASAAAVAAVAAATAFAARTSTASFGQDLYSTKNIQCYGSPRSAQQHDVDATRADPGGYQEPCESRSNQDTEVDRKPEHCHTPTSSCNTSTTTVTSTQPHAFPISSKANHLSSIGTRYPEEESAKTAAAVAAAACIGAMFSQPIGTGRSSPSSMAAMLGDLMGCNRRKRTQPSSSLSDLREVCRSHGVQHSMIPEGSVTVGAHENDPDSFHADNSGADTYMTGKNTGSEHSSSDTVSQSQFNSEVQLQNCLSHQTMPYSEPVGWSSVATTVASAAQAAAAAAVAATAAVTGSAKFFHLSKQHQQKPLSFRLGAQVNKVHSAAFNATDGTGVLSGESSTVAAVTTGSLPLPSSIASVSSMTGVTERTGLSPNTAVTMTSAAAAAAMVAAAASAAAKQHQIISEMQIPSYSSTLGLSCSGQARSDLSSCVMDYAEDSEYSVFENDGRFAPSSKRRSKLHTVRGKRYGYAFKIRKTPLHQSMMDDYDEEDGDVFDDAESTISPEVTPPYAISAKIAKHTDGTYSTHLDDSRLPSCETSPSDVLTEADSYRPPRRLLTASTTLSPNQSVQRFDRETDESKSRTEQQHRFLYPLGGPSRCHLQDTSGETNLKCGTKVNVLPKIPRSFHSCRPRRTKSADSRLCSPSPSPTVQLARSISYPLLTYENVSVSLSRNYEPVNPDRMQRQDDIPSETSGASVSSGSVVDEHVGGGPVRQFSAVTNKSDYVAQRLLKCQRERLQRVKLRLSRAGNQPSLARLDRCKAALKLRSTSNLKRSLRSRSDVRPQLTASPDSVLTEDYSGHDDGDDIDTEYYDDDLFDIADSGPLRKSLRPPAGSSSSSRLDTYVRTGFPTASMRQQHALKAENARLRRKLSDLMRQRGDLRAANEILLQQNARLRHSSKHVSAVARMAESATKIIEAHNKSQLVQSAPQTLPTSVYRTSGTVAVVAAPQQHTNNHTLSGVYVSSPTASNTQQPPHGIAALSGPNSLFPSAVMANAMSGTAIALPSHPSLTTVQIQSSSDTMVPTPVSTQPTIIHQHNESITPQASLTNFYQHPLGHPLGTLSASIANVAHPNLAPVSSAIQVCHYPGPSGGTVYPSMPHATAATPGIVPVGTPNAVTLLLGQAPPTAYAPVGPQTPSLHLANSLKTESATIGSVAQLQYPYHGPSAVLASMAQCPSNCSLANADLLGSSTTLTLAPSSTCTLVDSKSINQPPLPDYSRGMNSRSGTRRDK